MRIMAQTEVPANPSFMHLAYIAATQVGSPLGVVTDVLIVGLVVYYLIQRKSWVWKTGLVVAMIAAGFLPSAVLPVRYSHPEGITRMWARTIHSRIERLQQDHKPVSTSVLQLQRDCSMIKHTRDVWGLRFRVTSDKEGKETKYRVVSAGRDGEFNTKDDICYPPKSNTGSAL